MKQPRIFSLFVAMSFAAAALGQSAKGTAAATAAQTQPSQPPTLASMLDREISAIEKQILDIAEAMPEDKFNFSPELAYSRR